MTPRFARIVAAVAALVVLGGVNWSIAAKERIKTHGERIFLELAPVDPRSLMQGDYMALNYEIVRHLPTDDTTRRGKIVVRLDADGVASFVRMDRGEPLAAGEMLLQFRRGRTVRFGAESFFFQEGTAELYSAAKYGELRVDADGSSVLIGLRDDKFVSLGAAH